MHFPVSDAGLRETEGKLIAVVDDLIDVALLRGEPSGDGIGPGEVRGVVLVALHARIHHQEFAGHEHTVVAHPMENLTLLRADRRETPAPSCPLGDPVHDGANVVLVTARTDGAASGLVHFDAQVARLVQSRNLDILLDEAHRDDGLHEGLRGMESASRRHLLRHLRSATRHLADSHKVEVSKGRKEMDRPPRRQGSADRFVERVIGGGVSHPHAFGLLPDGRLGTGPHEVVQGGVVTVHAGLP